MKTKNKLLSFGIILCMLFSMAIMPAHAAIVDSGTCGENLTWTLDDEGTLTISGTGDMTDYSYPDYVPWYSLKSSIEKVIIQNGVTSIAAFAFVNCVNLTSITIPYGVTSIGGGAFNGCESLESVTIPDSVTSIGHTAFSNCGSLESVVIPDSVTSIGNDAFYYSRNLTSISIGNGVTSIGVCVFEDFYGTTIRIGSGVTSIEKYAFLNCPNLTGIEVDQNNQTYSSENGVLFNKDRTTLIAYPRGKTGSYTIPDSVTSIEDGAFILNGLITSVTIPYSVTSIGDGAFSSCSSLTDIYYSGTSSEWNSIRIKSGNDFLESAKIHYSSGHTSVTISEAACTEDSIKLISHMVISLGDTPVAFGTTFIPLWLFSDPSATHATVEYSVSEYPVVSGDTFGATLSGIPDGYKDVYFVGKSYIRLDDESVVWSNAKKVKIEENELRWVE